MKEQKEQTKQEAGKSDAIYQLAADRIEGGGDDCLDAAIAAEQELIDILAEILLAAAEQGEVPMKLDAEGETGSVIGNDR